MRAYQPRHDERTHETFFKPKWSKCLHYYFYFIDEDLGLCYLRVPTWCPFRLQFYFDGHDRSANQSREHGIAFEQADNAFFTIDDFETANQLAAQLDIEVFHAKLDHLAQQYCPVVAAQGLEYSWSIMQAEYATDLLFEDQSTLQAFYPNLLETLIQAVKPADVATFLGRKLHGNYRGEMGDRFDVRWLGTRIEHQTGPVTIGMYDEFDVVSRIETTVDDVSFFEQYRRVHHRDGTTSTKWASTKKTIYSLPALRENLLAANHRHEGFNLLSEENTFLFRLLASGEFFISGFTDELLRQHLPHENSGQVSRSLKRLRVHGLIEKVAGKHKYYLTEFGRQVVSMASKLREMVIVPELARAQIIPARFDFLAFCARI